MDAFCAVCHPMKADAGAAQKVALFNRMDERAGARRRARRRRRRAEEEE